MGRPDFNLTMRQARGFAQHIGDTAIWRKYVSASAGNPAYGQGDELCYVERVITGLFVSVTFEEIAAAGGQFIAGDMNATLLDCTPGKQDEIKWSGTTYRVESDVNPQALLGRAAWRMLLRRGDAY